MSKVTVIGGGSWGTALACLLTGKWESVVVWAREEEVIKGINEKHRNPMFLADVDLPTNLRAVSDLGEALAKSDLVLLVVPSQYMRGVVRRIRDDIPLNAPVVICSKGIENGTLMTMEQVLLDELPGKYHASVCVLSGPSFALELARGMPTNVTVAARDLGLATRVQGMMAARHFRIYTVEDVTGVELGAALKNVIAVAAGGAEGLGLGSNGLAGLVTRGLAEVTRLAVHMGGDPLTLSGLAGMGDLVLTCYGRLSRNRTVGYRLGKGETLKEILDSMMMVAEGITTARSVHDLMVREDVDMPISREVYEVLHENKSVSDAVDTLLSRPLKKEISY
ncbi:MAG: NAD(P)-dependent glycerol-3-phosphate dehydrogenase [Proteobacteria bacterium]|nr:NAD(P)-dependent glycerol-3-phosphate dehydrogenase [Pseudomonadota bacterium]